MARFFILVVLVLGFSYISTAQNSTNEQTKHEPVTAETTTKFTPIHHLTVETTKMDTNKTMTETLGQGREVGEGRTFALRRMQLILLPLMYKFGVMSTLLVLVFVMSTKILLIAMILLFIKVSSIISKFHHHEPPHHEISWAPPPPQPVHVHLHHSDVHDPHEYEHHDDHDDHHDQHDHHDPHDQHIQEMVYSGWEYPPPPSSNPYEKTIAMDRRGQYVVYKG